MVTALGLEELRQQLAIGVAPLDLLIADYHLDNGVNGIDAVAEILRPGARAVRTTLIVIGFISALGTLGIDVTAMVAGLGLTGFALGFALKDVLSNAVAGVLILFYRPFALGDRIVVSSMRQNDTTGAPMRSEPKLGNACACRPSRTSTCTRC